MGLTTECQDLFDKLLEPIGCVHHYIKLLFDKTNNHRSPGRVQLLMLTLVGALSYLLMAVDDPKNLPEVPTELLLLMGGSNLVYLSGKVHSSFPSLFQRKEKPDNQTTKGGR